MKRAATALIGLVIVGAGVWCLVTYGPYVRWYVRVRWRAVEASRSEPAALEAWQKTFGDPAAKIAALAAHDDNATAARLVALAPAAGVNFERPDDTAPAGAILAYVTSESMKIKGPASPPPDDVRSYLEAHQSGIGDVVDLLAHAEAPAWKADPWPGDSSPHLLGRKLLSEVLAAEALAQSSQGRGVNAQRAFLAGWQLNASLREAPELICQLNALQITSMQASLARRLAIDSASWRVRLGEHDYHASVMQALVLDASRKFSADDSQMQRAARADYLNRMRPYLVQLRDQPVTAQPHVMQSEADFMRNGWSAGAIVAELAQPGLDGAWLGANEVMLQLELTDRVLHARQLRAQLGRWPAAIPGIETSRLPGVEWIYVVSQDGRMSISIRQPPAKAGAPLRFEIE